MLLRQLDTAFACSSLILLDFGSDYWNKNKTYLIDWFKELYKNGAEFDNDGRYEDSLIRGEITIHGIESGDLETYGFVLAYITEGSYEVTEENLRTLGFTLVGEQYSDKTEETVLLYMATGRALYDKLIELCKGE